MRITSVCSVMINFQDITQCLLANFLWFRAFILGVRQVFKTSSTCYDIHLQHPAFIHSKDHTLCVRACVRALCSSTGVSFNRCHADTFCTLTAGCKSSDGSVTIVMFALADGGRQYALHMCDNILSGHVNTQERTGNHILDPSCHSPHLNDEI